MEKMTGNQFNLNRKKSLNPLPYYNLTTSPPDLQNQVFNPPHLCKTVQITPTMVLQSCFATLALVRTTD